MKRFYIKMSMFFFKYSIFFYQLRTHAGVKTNCSRVCLEVEVDQDPQNMWVLVCFFGAHQGPDGIHTYSNELH